MCVEVHDCVCDCEYRNIGIDFPQSLNCKTIFPFTSLSLTKEEKLVIEARGIFNIMLNKWVKVNDTTGENKIQTSIGNISSSKLFFATYNECLYTFLTIYSL